MATREIKTTIALDGEQSFKNSIKQITKEFRVLDSEMKTISSQYDLTGDKATFLAEKQSLLATKLAGQQNWTSGIRNMLKQMEDAYEDAERRLDQLRNELTTATEAGNDAEIKRLTEEVKRAETAFAKAASKVQDYQIQLNGSITKENTIQKELNQTQKALESTDREVEELGRDSIRAGRQLEEGIADGAENAENSVRNLMNTMQEDISSIKTSTAFTAVSGLWDMASGAFSAVSGFVDSTAEYRRELSFLEHAANTSGFDFEDIKEKLIEVQGITANATTSMEGLRSLLTVGVSERQLNNAVDNLLGATIQYPDLSFDSLASDFQETIATGSATGSFAELLNRVGVDAEKFNEALEKSPTLAGDVDAALAHLAAEGLAEVYEGYRKNNEEIVNYNENQAALEQELSEFGGTLGKYILTPLKTVLTEALQYVNDTVELAEEEGVDAALDKVERDAKNVLGDMNEARQEMSEDMSEAYADAVAWLVGNTLGNVLEGANLMVKDLTGGKVDLESDLPEYEFPSIIKGEKQGVPDAEKVKEDIKSAREEYSKFVPMVKQMEGGTKIVETLGTGEEWRKRLDEITIETQTAVPTIQAAGENAGEALSTGFESSVEDVEGSGEEAGDAAGTGFEKSALRFTTVARKIGAQIGADYAAGIESQYGRAMSAGSRLAAATTAGMSGGGSAAGAVTGVIGAAAAGAVNAVLNIDGKTFARVTAPYLSSALSVSGN